MITTAQAQPFGGPSYCCSRAKEDDAFSGFLILAIVLVVAGLCAWDWLHQSR